MDEMSDVYAYSSHTHNLHSLTTQNVSYFLAKSIDEIKKDLQINRNLLNNTTYFAYPFGAYNEEKIQLLKKLGFTMAYTTKPGKAKLGVNKLLIPREGIFPGLTLQSFAEKLGVAYKPIVPPPLHDPNQLFTDVKKGDELYESISILTSRGVINGFPDGSFKPFQDVTRGQAAKILANVLQLDLENVENPQFSDVATTNEYYKSIAALSAAGIINGYPDGTFKPSQPITRA